ncbi:isoaspartyl peptidase/L-asparaginase family protein [Diaminobutyricibacter sp. McL0608]|uniref:isoaspartyl peptidase/L-asparaginase family protein n=1 Tax=Leifsonia sp. McL0608 TaxID=3143537 RepID=UPI0031F32C1A
MATNIIDVAPNDEGFTLVLHGGAGGRVEELSLEASGLYEHGLRLAYEAGAAILSAGGSALDAVCETVRRLEDNPLFNAGRGAALTATGSAELDACVMTGEGKAGAVAVSRSAKNPVDVARAVLEESEHVLLVTPSDELVDSWGLERVRPEYFVTDARQRQLANVQARLLEGSRHGTVGAVAVDRSGAVAAATSTGGMVNQSDGRVGDTPVVGAGTYARDGVVAVSCTGQGESFIEGVVAHDIFARMRYGGAPLATAVASTIEGELDSRGAIGGIIAVGADGRLVVAHNSPAMFAAYRSETGLVTLT